MQDHVEEKDSVCRRKAVARASCSSARHGNQMSGQNDNVHLRKQAVGGDQNARPESDGLGRIRLVQHIDLRNSRVVILSAVVILGASIVRQSLAVNKQGLRRGSLAAAIYEQTCQF